MIDMEGYTNNTYYYGNYISNTNGPGMEFLQLGGGNPPRNPALDHNTNNTVTGNTFDSNHGYAMKTINSSSNPTGTISDNLYYEPGSGLTTGSFAGFTQTNNISISSASNLYNGGKQYSGTANTGGSSCTTGSACWSYQLYNGSSYGALSYDAGNDWWGTSGGNVSRFNLLPNATSSNWAAKAWTAPSTGTISLRGRVLKSEFRRRRREGADYEERQRHLAGFRDAAGDRLQQPIRLRGEFGFRCRQRGRRHPLRSEQRGQRQCDGGYGQLVAYGRLHGNKLHDRR